ncbi:MAG: AAA family ATPase, partial [Proteobacteria bacterium]|nr:AAA family ATPase [Pseudomonadota bacterium]
MVNAQLFNDDCDAFDVNIDEVSESNVTDSMWDLVAPSVAEDDSVTQKIGFTTLQENKEKEDSSPGTSTDSNALPSSSLSKLYFQAASRQGMRFKTYCEYINSLNAKQKEVVMFNRQWCKDYVHKHRLGKKKDGYRVFLSGCGGTGKSHVVRLIQRDMSYLLQHVLHPEPDQPIALVTAPTGSAAYNIGGSTIHSALCINDRSKGTMSYERKCMMQMKLEHLMLLITDEISMVGFDFFQRMNEVITSIKGLTGCNWGGICILTVGDLFQLPPVASTPVYMAPRNANSLNDLAPNGWEEFMLHELTEVMRQKDMVFANALNSIRVKQPELFSPEDDMLRGREVHLPRDHESYPHNAMHVYAQNVYCDEWNEFMLERLPGDIVTSIATDSRKDTSTNLANVAFSDKPRETGNLR